MRKCVVFSGTLKHEGVEQRTDYLCLKNGEGEDDTDGVRLKKVLLYPKGTKLGRAAATASCTDAGVSFDLYARKPSSTSTAVLIASVELKDGKKGAQETLLDVDFNTDTVVVHGEYEALSFKLEADTGREVQFQHVTGDEEPILELVDTEEDAEDEEMVEESQEGKDEEEGEKEEEAEELSECPTQEDEEDEVEHKFEIKQESQSTENEKDVDMKEELKEEEDEEKLEEEDEEAHDESKQEEEEDQLSIGSDLEMQDAVEMTTEEAQALEEQKAAEKKAKREQEDREALGLEEDESFAVERFEPFVLKCRRPPWRERAAVADAKAWELFCDAVSTFADIDLDSVIDDWVVTMENLLPALRGSLREAATNGLPAESSTTDLPLLMAEWARFGLCLDRADGQPSPAAFLRVGMGVVEQIAGYAFEPHYGRVLLDQGIVWDLMNVITETTFSALQTDALHAMHQLQSCRGVSLLAAEVFFRFEKAAVSRNEGEEGSEEAGKENGGTASEGEETSIYDSLALLIAQTDETGETTSLLDLSLRVLSRANLNASSARLTRAVRALAASQGADEGKLKEEAASALSSFIDSFHSHSAVARTSNHEGEALRAYSLLADCNWAGIMCVLLSHLKADSDAIKHLIKFTLDAIDEQECVGLFALLESPANLQKLLIKQLLLMGGSSEGTRDEEDGEEIVFDETPSLADRLDGRATATRLVMRLRALQLADGLAAANAGLSVENIDDEGRLAVLHAMLRLAVTDEGEEALGFVLSECAYSQVSAIPLLAAVDKKTEQQVRESAGYGYAVEVMRIVARLARRGRFWTRNARYYKRMTKNNVLAPISALHSWWEPFNEAAVGSGEMGSHSAITAIKNKLRPLVDKYKDGDPPVAIVALLRVVADMVTPPKAASRIARAARLDTVSFCLADGIIGLAEMAIKTALEYRATLFSLSTGIEGPDAEAFRELIHAGYRILRVLYAEQLREGKTAKGVSVNAAGYAVGLWALTTGVTKATRAVGRHGRALRRLLIDFLSTVSGRGGEGEIEQDWFGKSAATRVLRRMMDYGKDRMTCQPAALTLLCYLLEDDGTTAKNRTKEDRERDELTRKTMMEAVRESATPIATMLLNYAPYCREVARTVYGRLVTVLDRETFSALVRSCLSTLLYSFTTRPRRTAAVVDQEDVPVMAARERQRLMAKAFSELLTERRFVLSLLDRLHSDEQMRTRLQPLLECFASTTSNAKHESHTQFVVQFAHVLERLASSEYYDIEKAQDEETKEGEAKEEEAKDDGDEFMESDDRDCVTLDEVDEVEEEKEKDEKEDESKLDLPLRLSLTLVRTLCSPFAAPSASLAALEVLDGMLGRDEMATDTVRHAWLQRQPTARVLLQRLVTLYEGGTGSDEETESLLTKSAAHLERLFDDSDDGSRLLRQVLEVGAKAIPEVSGGKNRRESFKPAVGAVDDLMEKLKEHGKDGGWTELIDRAELVGNDKVTFPPRRAVPLRPSVLAELEDGKRKGKVDKLSIIVRLGPGSYSEVEMDEYIKPEMTKYAKKGRLAEERLLMAERGTGITGKKKPAKKAEEAKDAKGDKPSTLQVTATGKKRIVVSPAKKKTGTGGGTTAKGPEKKAEENIPNKIQPAVAPSSRPAKRTQPTTVPRAGIKRRR